ncbi:hypothetical protein CFB82_41715 [Burkholderia sp. HI2714]|uniref:hypothetical protein n=1 Tax=Burkholderia sp. HI2714 TaxID=2015359 RepID=UPI000B7A99A0|nr:hypothetical protein [Burkholderia sp. HI2714]OXJ21066.1 hypothetical protein CFB82_41715 [Burkholderia sp. HI2714]
MVALPIVTVLLWQRTPLLASVAALVIIVGMIYTIAFERSYVLFMDDHGVGFVRKGVVARQREVE